MKNYLIKHGDKTKIANQIKRSKNTVSAYFTGKHCPKTKAQLDEFNNACLSVLGFVPDLFPQPQPNDKEVANV
jgi:hypothetical protein